MDLDSSRKALRVDAFRTDPYRWTMFSFRPAIDVIPDGYIISDWVLVIPFNKLVSSSLGSTVH